MTADNPHQLEPNYQNNKLVPIMAAAKRIFIGIAEVEWAMLLSIIWREIADIQRTGTP